MHKWSNADDKRLLTLLANGLTIRECSTRLGMSLKSVECRAGRLRKLGVLGIRDSVAAGTAPAPKASSKPAASKIQVTSQLPKRADDIPVYVEGEDGEDEAQLQAGHEDFVALTALAKKYVKKGGLSLEELCDVMHLTPKEGRELTARAIAAGYHVDLHAGKLDFRQPSTDAMEHVVKSDYVPVPGEEIVVGVVSDPHFASKHHERAALQRHVDWLYESGVRHIFGPGDWMAGGYPFLKYEVTHAGIEDQADQVAQFIKQCGRDLTWMAISGNHDESHNVGIDGAKMIEQQLKSSGWNNFTYYGARAALLKLFNTRFAMHHPGGSLSYAVSYKIQKYVDETPPNRRAQFLFTGHCLPETYEVLTTNRGFVALKDMTTADHVLSYKDGSVVESPVLEVVNWAYTGDMAVFDNSSISQVMTDKHHLYTKDGRYLPVRQALETLTRDDLVHRAAPMDNTEEYPVDDAMLKFVVAYCADGNRVSKGSLRFHLKKQRKIDRLTQIVKDCGGSISWSELTKTNSRKSVGLSRETQLKAIELAPEKQLPGWMLQLSSRQRQLVIDELVEWDGSVLYRTGNARQFHSKNKTERDTVQMLLAQHGITSRVSGINVSFNPNRKAPESKRLLQEFCSWEKVQDVRVGCIRTENQNFFVRTDSGSIELTGNTHQQLYMRRGGCHSFLCGTFENGDSSFGRMLGGDVAVGSWLIKYRLDQNNNVLSVTPTFRAQEHQKMTFIQVPEKLTAVEVAP